jgi:hypothetical protein
MSDIPISGSPESVFVGRYGEANGQPTHERGPPVTGSVGKYSRNSAGFRFHRRNPLRRRSRLFHDFLTLSSMFVTKFFLQGSKKTLHGASGDVGRSVCRDACISIARLRPMFEPGFGLEVTSRVVTVVKGTTRNRRPCDPYAAIALIRWGITDFTCYSR